MPKPKDMLVKAPERDPEAELAKLPEKTSEALLRLREKRFVSEYPKDLNATQAAIRAGYSPVSAGTLGSRLLQKVEIQTAIARRIERLAAIADVDQIWVLERLKDLHNDTPHDNIKLGALTQLAKVLGLAMEKIDLTSNGQTVDGGIKQVMIFGDKEIEF